MSSRPRLHPLQALYGAHERAAGLPVVDHYAGVEARMRKALELQGSMADDALFDVTLDLEDGAPVGGEAATLAGLAYGQTVLAKACQAADIDFDGREAHSARYDTEKTAELFCGIVNRWKQMGGWEDFDD